MSDPHSLTKESRPRRHLAMMALLAILAFAILVHAGVVWWEFQRVEQKGREVLNKIKLLANYPPVVHSSEEVITDRKKTVLEFVTFEDQRLVRKIWDNSRFYSVKTLEFEATFTVRAGFDLRDSFQINVDPQTHEIRIKLPPTKILSIDMSDVHELTDENGYWNPLTPEDRQQTLHELETQARKEFQDAHLLEEARKEGEDRIRTLLKDDGQVIFLEDKTSPSFALPGKS